MNLITAEKGNSLHYQLLAELMFEYVDETDQHKNISTPKEIIPKTAKSMIDKINDDRILQIATNEHECIGFYYAKIDKEGDKGLIRPNWGYIMEFFVRKPYRRKGYGRRLVELCENFFANKGADNIWLTADAVTGIPFWLACNYIDSNEISIENDQKILIKNLHVNQER